MASKIQADLHIHTNCSDGTFTPREVVERAHGAGLDVIAITDHDSMAGVPEAQQHGDRCGVEVIAGAEISAYHGEQEFHIIGLHLDTVDPDFLQKLDDIRTARRERIFEMVDKLKKMGVELDGQEVVDSADGGSPGRPHVAQALVDHSHVKDISEAFYRYVGDSGPAFVPKRYLKVEDAIAAIHGVGGVSILAHPGVTDRDHYIPLFVEMGLNGLEAYYPIYSREQTAHYLDMAQRMGLLVSGGSDCHGKRKAEIMIGRVRVPGPYVERIAAAAAVASIARLLPRPAGEEERS